ncbi:hypothetical protein ACFO4P_16980 [Epilithonimonas pallida]|uniref:Uncharacterized protein n=1 Tax=Epilithonimonas pallida TaxID=373671 RepID=A0ABY1R807_9FLAO|nr:hypothetical protein [Epilithonimonas pallida]SMP94678.1 hypothetical protein SAMN05421679_10681 [Epilithonimonas pallida]
MNSEWLDVQSFKLIPSEHLPKGITRNQILDLAESFSPFEHTIGTAKFISEKKTVAAGEFWSHEFQFTSTSYVTEFDKQFIKKTGAVVIYTDLRTLVMYQNDIFSNAPLVSSVKSNNEITEVNFSISSLFVL